MAISAVITGDIVGSTQLSKPQFKKLMLEFSKILAGYQYEFFRGDSFQVFVKSPAQALSVLLQMRTAAMNLLPSASFPVSDVRASIGLGAVKVPIRSLQTATDEVFILSGRAFDKMNAPQRLLITGSEKNAISNTGLQVVCDFIDYIFTRLTVKQAAVVFELLMNRTQTETAKRLKKSQATIHKHVQSAGWPEIEKLLAHYKLLVSTIIL